ncbi:heterokaryon incompatibility [Fusarium beomiforme]|uniref:Heterokaryon incompatibility n=1 Tax=Fusarium beomiforme TaxID=44412 RepID=A0A9P5A9T6_9HYPO|nr:heterokaryon incompatibility [Fusarium beomiforme]
MGSRLTWVYGRTHRAQDVSNEAVDEYKDIIQQLYLDQNMTRDEVLNHLKESYGFSLSTNQFSKATKRWGFYKQPRQAPTSVQAPEPIAEKVDETDPVEELFDFEPDTFDTIDETEAWVRTGSEYVPDPEILENVEDQLSSSELISNGHDHSLINISQPQPMTMESPYFRNMSALGKDAQESICLIYLSTIEYLMTTGLAPRTVKREFLGHFVKHHAGPDLTPEDNRTIDGVQFYQRTALDCVFGEERDTVGNSTFVREAPPVDPLHADVRMTNSGTLASNKSTNTASHSSSYSHARQRYLTSLSTNPTMTRLLASGISADCSGIVVGCAWGQPAILKFKDTLNDHFASWYLLYKPRGTIVPSWPSLGGPGETLNDLGSELSLKFVKDHLNECLNSCDSSHATCKQPRNKPLPKRALDVRGEKVNLCYTEGQCGNYTALSYRWGPPEETLRTIDSNISDMMSGIELPSFPKLLQDAITLTRRLDIRYIWVDALCIIQGNKEDWENEAPKMGDYYKNAILTIAASLANQVSEPFLVPREEIPPQLLSNFDFISFDGTVSQIIVRRVPDYGGIPLVSNSPLSTRAWTWQENVLSTRIAHFSRHEIVWECRSQQAFENGAKLQCAVGLAYRLARAGDDLEYYWKALVADYSKRELTYESDRLPAISSVASYFSILKPGKYLAGVWEQWLFSDMTWMSSWGADNAFPPIPKQSSEMPSWSWASVAGLGLRSLARLTLRLRHAWTAINFQL